MRGLKRAVNGSQAVESGPGAGEVVESRGKKNERVVVVDTRSAKLMMVKRCLSAVRSRRTGCRQHSEANQRTSLGGSSKHLSGGWWWEDGRGTRAVTSRVHLQAPLRR